MHKSIPLHDGVKDISVNFVVKDIHVLYVMKDIPVYCMVKDISVNYVVKDIPLPPAGQVLVCEGYRRALCHWGAPARFWRRQIVKRVTLLSVCDGAVAVC